MNRNSDSYFSQTPARVDMPRSILPRDQEIVLSFNTGDLIPFYVDEVLPGSTHQVDTAKAIRLQTPITPFFGDMFLDTYYFFVPNRLVWDHWQEFCGENNTSAWVPQVTYSIPQIKSPTLNGSSYGWTEGTIADYMGIPINTPNLSINALPFRAYALICQDFFRSEVLTDPLNIPTGDSDVTPTDPMPYQADYINNTAQGVTPFRVAKVFDYFTAALPAPEKADEPVAINLSALNNHNVGVYGDGNAINFKNDADYARILASNGNIYPNGNLSFENSNLTAGQSPSGTALTGLTSIGLAPENSHIFADMSEIASTTLLTINQLRQAFQVQKFYERLGYGGSRYIEILKSMFGVSSPDARLQRPEYLGGNRIPINVSQVVQTSQTGTTPQGNVSAMSFTTDYHSDFTKSFVEHGYIIGVMCVRYKHIYQQGIERMWSRKTRFDFYWPLFANLGYQPILNKEIYAQGDGVTDSKGNIIDEQVFGYQECWSEYKYKPSRTAGSMRSTYSAPLDVWHLGDKYNQLPALSDDWIREDSAPIQRVIAVSQKLVDEFLCDILVKNKTTQPMPVYSIPGLVDHH